MVLSTLCYICRGSDVLMLHRVKKEKDINKDKWIGVGGKFLPGEAPEECLFREVQEETGLTLTQWQSRGIVTFTDDTGYCEYMHLFTADGFEGQLKACDEGDLQWVSRNDISKLAQWEGDKLFLQKLWDNSPFFLMHLHYSGEALTSATCNGKNIL